MKAVKDAYRRPNCFAMIASIEFGDTTAAALTPATVVGMNGSFAHAVPACSAYGRPFNRSPSRKQDDSNHPHHSEDPCAIREPGRFRQGHFRTLTSVGSISTPAIGWPGQTGTSISSDCTIAHAQGIGSHRTVFTAPMAEYEPLNRPPLGYLLRTDQDIRTNQRPEQHDAHLSARRPNRPTRCTPQQCSVDSTLNKGEAE